MLITITYKGENATDLGYLLHKNPNRTQQFDMSFGSAYVFYPVATETVTTAALLLDLNPIDLARGKVGSKDGGLFDYVNDRPYVQSSFMSSALAKVFGTAMSGRCDKRPDLVGQPLNLEVKITMLPCRGNIDAVKRLFEPLGYKVEFETSILDETFPEWGNSHYINLTLNGTVRLADLLNHLYVLIPVFDRNKHYWVSDDEIEKLLKHGEGWLTSHPEKELIAHNYFNKKRRYAYTALERLVDDPDEIAETDEEEKVEPAEQKEKKISLNEQRLTAVMEAVRACGASKVLDLGCGEGRLLQKLLDEKQITSVTGVDVSMHCLERAQARLKLDRMNEHKKAKLTLMQGSATYRDKRFSGFDLICVVEVIEHLDVSRLSAFERVVFEFATPPNVIVTTPNEEYNINYENLSAGTVRHTDHRFEWKREEFKNWANDVCEKFGYTVEFSDIGEIDDDHGTPTQMGRFTKCE